MAYVAPRTWTTGELVTEAMMNQDVRDNMVYVKAEVDKIHTVSVSEPGRAWNTIYQNTSGKIRLVIITAGMAGGANQSYSFKIGSASPPLTQIGLPSNQNAAAVNEVATFVVPVDYYYTTVTATPPTMVDWIEFDLF